MEQALLGSLRNEVVAVLSLLQATEGHLGTGNELLGVLEVGELQLRQRRILEELMVADNVPECSRPR